MHYFGRYCDERLSKASNENGAPVSSTFGGPYLPKLLLVDLGRLSAGGTASKISARVLLYIDCAFALLKTGQLGPKSSHFRTSM